MVHLSKSAESLLQSVHSQSQPGVWDTFPTDFQFKVVKTDCILRWKVLKNPPSSSDCTGTCWQSVKMTQTWRLWPFFLLHLSSGLSGTFFSCLPQSSPKLSWTKVDPTFTWQLSWRKPYHPPDRPCCHPSKWSTTRVLCNTFRCFFLLHAILFCLAFRKMETWKWKQIPFRLPFPIFYLQQRSRTTHH